VEVKPPRNKQDMVRVKYGANVTVKKEITIGGENTLVFNAAGDLIAKV
jgi:hypothetical protein